MLPVGLVKVGNHRYSQEQETGLVCRRVPAMPANNNSENNIAFQHSFAGGLIVMDSSGKFLSFIRIRNHPPGSIYHKSW